MVAKRMWLSEYTHPNIGRPSVLSLRPRSLASPRPESNIIEYPASDTQAYSAFLDKCSVYTEQPPARSQTLLIAFDAEQCKLRTFDYVYMPFLSR
jgi:hypothetical protein